MIKELEELKKFLQSYSGLLSRMKERDGNEKLNQICLDEWNESLHE